nr:putative holin-like toxin [Enterococcus cecorum]
MSVTTLQRILKKGNCAMSVYEALSLMIAFATLIVLVNNKDNKK